MLFSSRDHTISSSQHACLFRTLAINMAIPALCTAAQNSPVVNENQIGSYGFRLLPGPRLPDTLPAILIVI